MSKCVTTHNKEHRQLAAWVFAIALLAFSEK